MSEKINRRAESYSDEYIAHYGDMYMTYDKLHNLNGRGIRFEAFLASPERYMEIINQTEGIQDLVEKHELEIESLPGGGTRYGAFFQHVSKKKKQRHHRKSHINEQRVHA